MEKRWAIGHQWKCGLSEHLNWHYSFKSIIKQAFTPFLTSGQALKGRQIYFIVSSSHLCQWPLLVSSSLNKSGQMHTHTLKAISALTLPYTWRPYLTACMESQGEAHKTSGFHIKIDTVRNLFCYNCDIARPPYTVHIHHLSQLQLTTKCSVTYTVLLAMAMPNLQIQNFFSDLCTFEIKKMSPTCHGTYTNKETNANLYHFLNHYKHFLY